MQYIDDDGTPVTVYQPDERQGWFIWGLRKAADELRRSRHVILRLFLRDFTAQFRQRLLGYFWAFLSPFLSILSFLFLYFTGVLQPGDTGVPYPVYVLMGSSIWSCLPGALGAVSGGLSAQADLIMRTRVPKIALAVSSLAGLVYATLVSMLTIAAILLLYGMVPSWWLLAYPLLVLPMLLLGTAMGLVLAVVGAIAKDFTQMAAQALAILMYFTPVIYIADTIQNPLVRKVIFWNPLTYLVDAPRSLVTLGSSPRVGTFLWISLGVLAAVIVGIRVFYLLEDLVAERL